MIAARRPPVWLVALLVLLAFAFQGSRGIWEPDEGRYTSTALNMLHSGDFLVPSIDREHQHLTKPPLTYWALAGSFAAFGRNEWAARAPGALAYIATGLLVFGLGRRFCPAKPWLPALVYGLSLVPFMSANVISTDVLLALFETAAMYALVRAWTGAGSMDRRWVHVMWLAWGLAFMTKGPPGLLPLLAMTAMLALQDRSALRRMLDPLGLLIFAVVAFTWFGILVAQEPERLRYFLGYEVYDRVFTAAHGRNAEWYGGFLIYGTAFVFGALPWWVLALTAAGGPRAAWSGLWTRFAGRDRDWILLAWWFLLPLAIFLLARSRLQLYVLPLFVPLSLMLSRPLARWSWLTPRRLAWIAGATASVLLGLKGFAAHVPNAADARHVAKHVRSFVDPRSVDAIAFVGMRPYYGLNLYLDGAIESVTAAGDDRPASKYSPEQDLCSQMDAHRRSAYVVKARNADRFVASAAECGHPAPKWLGYFANNGTKLAVYAWSRDAGT